MGTRLEKIALVAIEDHLSNPAVKTGIWREDVIDNIARQIADAGEYPQQHALRVRVVGDGYQCIAGHHRIRAAGKAGISEVWAWVEEMSDDAARMELALDNNHGEWSPMFYGIHCLEHVGGSSGGRGKKGGLREYAAAIGRKHPQVIEWRNAASVALAVSGKTFYRFMEKTYHLAAIHHADESLWSMLVDQMLKSEWTVKDTKHWIEQVNAFDIPDKWANLFIPKADAQRRFLETREFSPKTVNRICASADSIDASITAAGIEEDTYRQRLYGWLRDNAGADSWDVRKIEGYGRALLEEINRHRTTVSSSWRLGDWRDHIGDIEDKAVALLLTDPPYGIDYQSNYQLDRRKERKHKRIKSDGRGEAFKEIGEMLTAFDPKMRANAHVLLFCHWSTEPQVRQAIEGAGYKIRGSLIWAKNATGMGDPNTTFAPKHERIIHAVKGSPILFSRCADVIEADRVPTKNHPTEKPLDLLTKLIEVTTVEGEMVADPFGGFASTIMAAMDLKREYWGCEIDEEYHAAGAERLSSR